MSELPPYSTFRTHDKQMMYPQALSPGNILSFVPPGFKQVLNIKFPDSRLAVCVRCKKNFKARQLCRVRNGHTDKPWSIAYVCITLDDSCITSDNKYVDSPLTVRMAQWQPFKTKRPIDIMSPVCALCKKTNQTRDFCRKQHQHCQLPWNTVYVVLSALEKTDPNSIIAAPSKLVGNENVSAPEKESGFSVTTTSSSEVKKGNSSENKKVDADKNEPTTDAKKEADVSPPVTKSTTEASPSKSEKKEAKPESQKEPDKSSNDDSDDINDIDMESKTFLVEVSAEKTRIQWLTIDSTDVKQGLDEMQIKALNSAIRVPGQSSNEQMYGNSSHSGHYPYHPMPYHHPPYASPYGYGYGPPSMPMAPYPQQMHSGTAPNGGAPPHPHMQMQGQQHAQQGHWQQPHPGAQWQGHYPMHAGGQRTDHSDMNNDGQTNVSPDHGQPMHQQQWHQGSWGASYQQPSQQQPPQQQQQQQQHNMFSPQSQSNQGSMDNRGTPAQAMPNYSNNSMFPNQQPGPQHSHPGMQHGMDNDDSMLEGNPSKRHRKV